MYESKQQRPLASRSFVQRLLLHLGLAALVMAGSLAIGMVGYHRLEHLPWIDAFLNAAMLLGGMGPVNTPVSDAGKLFAGIYALYAGLVFLVTAGLMFAPVLHRLMHRFHWDDRP
jgi:hypothetical protein